MRGPLLALDSPDTARPRPTGAAAASGDRGIRGRIALTTALLLACSKAELAPAPLPAAASSSAAASTGAVGAPSPPAVVSAVVAPGPAPSVSVAAAPPVVPPPAATAAHAAPSTTASAVVAAPTATVSTPPPAPPKPVTAHLSSPRWSIDFSSPGGCTASSACTAQLRVEALGDYHVNGEYRFRFVPGAAAGIAFTGGAPTDFALQGPKVGVMSLGFTPSAAGTAALAGTFKICVCTDSECNPEQVAVALSVPVSGG